MTRPLHILAIHAHPDDVEFLCSGTLLLLKEKGWRITVVTMTPGDCGTAEMSAEEISAVRRGEAKKAADMLGADYHCLEFRDLTITHDHPSRQRVAECLRTVRPDVVMTAPPVCYMSDHEMTSRLVRDAAFSASVPNYVTGAADPAPPTERIPYLYYVDAVEGIDYYGQRHHVDFYVDVTSVFETKRELLACHASQRNWLLRQHGIDEYLEAQKRWSHERGKEIGVEFAEGFRQHVGHPYPHDNIIFETLLPLCRKRS